MDCFFGLSKCQLHACNARTITRFHIDTDLFQFRFDRKTNLKPICFVRSDSDLNSNIYFFSNACTHLSIYVIDMINEKLHRFKTNWCIILGVWKLYIWLINLKILFDRSLLYDSIFLLFFHKRIFKKYVW